VRIAFLSSVCLLRLAVHRPPFQKLSRGNRIALYIGLLLWRWPMSGPRGCYFRSHAGRALSTRLCGQRQGSCPRCASAHVHGSNLL